MRRAFQRVLWLSFGLLVLGCGSKGPAEPDLALVPAGGVVTLDGKPLADASVSFLFDGKPPAGFVASGAKCDSAGKFTVMTGSKPGTVAGRYKVMISLFRMQDGTPVKEDPESGMDAEMLKQGGQAVESIPARYNDVESTELSADIPAAGKTDLEFNLSGS